MLRQLIVVAALGLVGTIQAKTFLHTFTGVPKTADCNVLAKEIAEKFEEHSGKTVSFSMCTGATAVGYTIELRYESDVPLNIVTTWPLGGGYYEMGRFKTRELCDASLEEDRRTFEAQTMLSATFGYCTSNGLDSTYPFGPRIQAFGKSARNYFVSGLMLFSVPKDQKLSLRPELTESLGRANAHFVDAKAVSKMTYLEIAIHYYAEKRLLFEVDDKVVTQTYEECELQRAEAMKYLTHPDSPLVKSYCGTEAFGSWALTNIFMNNPFRSTSSIETFGNFKDCRAALPTLVSKYGATAKGKLVGGSCSLEKKVYHVRFFFLDVP